jgi:hypothetical protein
VEPAFGNTTGAKRLDAFTLRGRKKVRVHWMICAMVHNIEKIEHCGPPGIQFLSPAPNLSVRP